MTKTVMITGAGSGFGKGASLALAARGHRVIATTETEDQAAALRAEGIGVDLVPFADEPLMRLLYEPGRWARTTAGLVLAALFLSAYDNWFGAAVAPVQFCGCRSRVPRLFFAAVLSADPRVRLLGRCLPWLTRR